MFKYTEPVARHYLYRGDVDNYTDMRHDSIELQLGEKLLLFE